MGIRRGVEASPPRTQEQENRQVFDVDGAGQLARPSIARFISGTTMSRS
jgi:hypothetical protein